MSQIHIIGHFWVSLCNSKRDSKIIAYNVINILKLINPSLSSKRHFLFHFRKLNFFLPSFFSRVQIKMYSLDLLTTFALFGLAHAGTKIGFGPDFAVDSTGTTWIREANSTLILPKTPSPQVDRLALWPGMETSNGNLIQAIAVSFADPAA